MKKLLFSLLLIFSLSTVCFAEDFNGYIVKVAENSAEKLMAALPYSSASLLSEMTDSEVVDYIAKEYDTVDEISSDMMLVGAQDEDTLEELKSLGIVEHYEKNFYLDLLGYDVTTNPNYIDQKWYLDYINADFAWDAAIYGNDVIVAVIDSGVTAHDDIKKNLLQGVNYVDVNVLGDSYTHDNSDHGTSVASIIASECNTLATVGISFKSKILPLKVTNDSRLELKYAVAAIEDAVKQGCDVINLSFGVHLDKPDDSPSLKAAIDYAINNNVIVVAAAGNDGDSGYVYPASYENVVSVANAQKSGDSLIIRSTSQRNDKVDIAALGTSIHSVNNEGNVSNNKTGTSFSCPMISAVAALAKSVNPDISQSQFEDLLKSSADSSYIALSGQDSLAWGAGLVDIENFFRQMLAGQKCYVSDPLTFGEECFVYITNLSETNKIENGTVILSEYDSDGYLSRTKSVSVSIDEGDTFEFSLTAHGFDSNATIKVVCDYLPGDVNGDGEVNIRDASAILRYNAGYAVSVVEAALDVNGDGEVTIRDASAILRFCAGYNVELN